MYGVTGRSIVGTPSALPAPWRLVLGCLLGPGAYLSSVHSGFDTANLSGADLTGVDLTGANLDLTTLEQTKLTNANLSSATLSDADLTNANLTNANLKGADLTGALVSGITWSKTTCPDGTRSDTNGTRPQSCNDHGGGL